MSMTPTNQINKNTGSMQAALLAEGLLSESVKETVKPMARIILNTDSTKISRPRVTEYLRMIEVMKSNLRILEMYISASLKSNPEAFDETYRERDGKPAILLSKELSHRLSICESDIGKLFSLFRLEPSKDLSK